ncbi:cation efflux family protein [Chaetomium sp. MPI-SDFR-AT-0129]|nr:cation efflux family protein [Chaetomium sp. MPI-SDFR-AT-0129]
MALKLSDKQKVSAAIVISFAFFIAEIVVAIKTGSLALMADAFHYLNDLIGFIVTLWSIIIEKKTEYRQDFSFGWQRARLLGSFFNGAFLLALGVSIFLQSIERFIAFQEVSDAKLILIVGCVGLGLNIITITFLHENHHGHGHGHHNDHDHESQNHPTHESEPRCFHQGHADSDCPSKEGGNGHLAPEGHSGHRHVSLSLKAPGRDLGMMGALLHVIGDALNNLGVIIAAVVILFTSSPGRFYADPAVGLAISLMIVSSAIPLARDSGEILLQSAPVGVDLADIKHDLEKIPGVDSVHELHVWRLDQRKAIASAHVIVSDLDATGFMAKARTIRECLHAYGIHSTTVQPELLAPFSIAPSTQPSIITVTAPATVGSAPEISGGPYNLETPRDPAGNRSVNVNGDSADAGGGEPGGNSAAESGSGTATPCQIVCGRGGCDALMCCNSPV